MISNSVAAGEASGNAAAAAAAVGAAAAGHCGPMSAVRFGQLWLTGKIRASLAGCFSAW